MTQYPKEMTSPFIYQEAFIYTDGTKNSFSTSFAAVNDIGEAIKIGILVDHSSFFTAEALL